MNNFKTLFHFESEIFSLIEIKRLLPNETEKSKLYFWLLFDKAVLKLQKLVFVSMSSDGELEFRVFENLRLSFDKQKALLVSNNIEFQLKAVPTDVNLTGNLQLAIGEFMDKMC
ncbi:MAG: hypothetical protein PHS59_11720 [Paludibacter sp.]|nr:hypothetical protein [Paludibacter sp.]